MDLFIEIAGPLAAASMIAPLVICAVDGIKRAPVPDYDNTRADILVLTVGTIYNIVGATLAGWLWYRYMIQPNSGGYWPGNTDGHLIINVVFGAAIAIGAACALGFGGNRALRGTYRVSRALRQRILKSLSDEEQSALVRTFSDNILSAELNGRLEAGIQFTLSDEGQRSLVQALPGGILNAEVLKRIDAGTLSVEEQRSLVQMLPGDILSSEVARIDAGALGTEGQRSLVQALPGGILNAEVLERIAAGALSAYEIESIIRQAPRRDVLAAFCELNLSSLDLTPYYLGRLAKLFGLSRLVTMVSSEGADNLDDDNLKRFANLFDLARLVDMLLIQIGTREEQSSKRLGAIDRQIRELNSTLREFDRRRVKLQERLSVRSQMDDELPDALRGVRLGSLSGEEVEILKGMVFTTKEREELLGELMKVLDDIAQGNAKNNRLGQQHDAEVLKQDGLSSLRSLAQSLKKLIALYGAER